jgi:glycosyltransferase involved in cell wall biosynthesis
MAARPLVSVILPFYNTPPDFMREAFDSVLGQSYAHWELLLIDDGSAPDTSRLAHSYVAKHPGRVRCVEHPGHANRGMSASRNLGIAHAAGEYVAFLDADDVWMPHTLREQVAILEAQPRAAMVYGNAEYWYSWTGLREDQRRDFTPRLGISPNQLVDPPRLAVLFLDGRGAVPCPCSLMTRRRLFANGVVRFEEAFRGLYEDQVFYFQVCLQAPVFVSGRTWARYRQHSAMSTQVAADNHQLEAARLAFLLWLKQYLQERHIRDVEVWQSLAQQMWLCSVGSGTGWRRSALATARWAKKWVLRLQRHVLPTPLQRWIWLRGQASG